MKSKLEIIIRPIQKSDTWPRHKFWVDLSLAQQGIINTIDEIDYHATESEAKIEDFLLNHRGLWLLALNNKEDVIGEVDIIFKPLQRIRHVGQVTIATHPHYQRQGVASQLLHQAITWASENALKRLELYVFANNLAAQALYKKFAFSEEGCRKNYIQHQDHSFEDDILMARLL